MIPRDKISKNAILVLDRLVSAGYEAYLVGGSVRDLLLEGRPKDFDVSTSAKPEEVKALFRNSRMIGRRFKIVHVRYGNEIIEVATFRAKHEEVTHGESHSETGMIISDNVYGTFEEDIQRRDFTLNALYYDATSQEVIDEVGGLDDIDNQTIRLIGDPEDRYREDPVRMLRAIRFAAKLNFHIDPVSAEPIREMAYLIQDVPPARLFEELLKLMMMGKAAENYALLKEFKMLPWLFPDTHRSLENHPTDKLVTAALKSTDRRISENMPVTPAFIFAALLWYPYNIEKDRLESEGMNRMESADEALAAILAKQQVIISIPRRFSGPMRDIFQLQNRLKNTRGKKPFLLMNHKRFRAAYDFLLLREQAGEKLDELGDWWTRFQDSSEEERSTMSQLSGINQGRTRRPRRRKKSPGTHPSI